MVTYFYLATRDEMLRIIPSQILWLKANGSYSQIRLINGLSFEFSINLSKLTEILRSKIPEFNNQFIRTGKSYFINKQHILSINTCKETIILDGGIKDSIITIKISKELLRELRKTIEMGVIGMDKTIEKVSFAN